MSSGKIATEAGKLAIPAGGALVAQYLVAGNPVTIAATAVALPYLLGGVVVVSAAYATGKYFDNRR